MNKITSDHLARAAFVYVRQSTAYQVANNLESQRRQYGLVERARQLGWEDVQVVDDDLGRSGAEQPGRASRSCWPRSAKARSERWFRWKPRAWPVMALIGIPCWSSAAWSAR
jgi:hypothetical protein